MGTFHRPRRRICVDFTGHEDETLHGLVVTYTTMSTGKLLDLMTLTAEAKDAAEQRESLERMIGRLAEGIVEWNYCEEGQLEPAPITVDVLLRMEPDLLFILVDQWQEAVAGVAAPLGGTSPSGAQSLAELPTTEL